jgi:DNA repair exonuclease SbcCD ATPase subunit
MSGPSLSQPPNPLSFLWERQLKQEHSRLQQRMNEQDAILATVHKRILEAEKASGMSNAASRDVRQLRDDLESYMNDPEEKEKDQRIVNILRDHEEEIRGLETKTNNWRSSFESCQDEVSKLEDTYGQRIKEIELKLEKRTTARESDINTEISKRTSDRLGALEAQNNRLSELVPQLNKLQTTLNSIKSISEGQAVEIVRLKQALDEAQKKIEAEQSSGNRTKQPQQPQVLVPRSPVLTDNYP